MIQARREKLLPLPVDVIPMQKHHLPEVYAIEVSAYPRPWPFKCFMDEITRNKVAHYVVALHGAKVVGYAGLWLVMDEAHITNIAVSYGYRRMRIGEQMLAGLIDYSLNLNANTMFLEVRRYNLAAQLLYTRYGFEPIQVREKYYADNDEDAIVLRVEEMCGEKFQSTWRANTAALTRALKTARAAMPDDDY